MGSFLYPIRFRMATFGVAAGVLLSGCAGGSVINDANLSPAENQLRQSNARFNQTVAEGAGTGALVGGIAGLAFGGKNRGQAALLGAAAGGALGAGAGYVVARNNLSRSSTEAQFNDAIQQAGAQADQYRTSANNSRDIADQALADAKRLGDQYRAHQITQEQYQSGLAKYQIDSDMISKQIGYAQQASASIRADSQMASGSNRAQLVRSAADVEASTRNMQQTLASFSNAVAAS
jgi:hypothetical protein